jgi:hypothetical protein
VSSNSTNKLEAIKERINQYDMRFPVAHIVKETGLNKGYVSAVLQGKKPISDNFWQTFNKAFPNKAADNAEDTPPPYIQISWQDYMKLIHLSLTQLMAGQNEILKQQAQTRAEVRGYGKYHLVKDAKGKSETFDKLLVEVDKLVNNELREDHGQGNPAGM